MNILMLAPEPFFEPRGTPISVYFRIRALGRLGHRVDLITYPLGKDVQLPNLKIIRPANLFGFRRVRIGPSLAKIPLDGQLLGAAVRELARGGYDLVFSHEEAAAVGVALSKICRLPHVYDMHSSLPQQLRNFEFSRSPLLISVFRRMERAILRGSDAIIVICRDLLDQVSAAGCAGKAVLLENYLDFPAEPFSPADVAAKRKELAPRGEKIVVYAGNFEPYQGIALLLQAVQRADDAAVFLLVGGAGRPLAEMKALAAELGVSRRVVFVDKVPPSKVAFYVALADVLVSPRLSGTNTPLKIYSFLKTGKPLVATRLWTHTQVLDPGQAVLADPDPESFAAGISFALRSEEAGARAAAAKARADAAYTEKSYLERMTGVLELARRNFRRPRPER
jgi:glycosyltransferase involved in cell wall biosynthesis